MMSLQEMKDDIIKQVNITEELTLANKGSKKSIIEIETGLSFHVLSFIVFIWDEIIVMCASVKSACVWWVKN